MSQQNNFAEVNGTHLYFEQAGSGQPLIMLHGFGLNMRMWDDQFETLARHYRVVRYDMRGFGQSLPPTAAPFSHADDLKGLLDHLAIEHTHIMGLSLGGSISVDFALLYPEYVNRLVLVDSALGGHHWSQEWDASVTPIWAHGHNGDVAIARRLWFLHPLFEPAVLNKHCRNQLQHIVEDDSGWHWINQGLEQGLHPSVAKRLGDIKSSTLVIVGERDLPDFHAIADLLQGKIPGARKVELAGVGHMSNMEAPERFNEVVQEFLGLALS